VQKFSSDGLYISKWGGPGSGNGQFNGPWGIAINRSDPGKELVYVTDHLNNRVQIFKTDGEFVGEWGSYCDISDGTDCVDPDGGGPLNLGDGQLNGPTGVEVDSSGFVYAVDRGNHRVQKLTEDGQVVSIWGKLGSDAGALNSPEDVAVTNDRYIYITDTNNNRIQVSRIVPPGMNNKAIIVAGGGPYAGNGIIDATYRNANFAYRTMNYQGFDKDLTWYMSGDTRFDLDDNFLFDDVDAGLSNANLQDAICGEACGGTPGSTGWAMDANNLVLYLVDHGGANIFRMNETEMLNAEQLDSWLDTYQSQSCPTGEALNTSFSTGAAPAGWTVVDNVDNDNRTFWNFDAPDGNRGNLTGGTGLYAVAGALSEPIGDNLDTELRTPVFDASNLESVILEFKTNFTHGHIYGGGWMVADVDISINPDADSPNWINVWSLQCPDHQGPLTESVDITQWAAGQEKVMVRFHYYETENDFPLATYNAWWQVDDVKIQGKINKCHTVTLVYDACESGSFLPYMTPPEGRDRIVIASTDAGEQALFALQGRMSFSESFWTGIFTGSDVLKAFKTASDEMGYIPTFQQTPHLDDTGDGQGNQNLGGPAIEAGDDGSLAQNTMIGNGTNIFGDAPTIAGVSVTFNPAADESMATINAEGVTGRHGIARVWAVILSENMDLGDSNNPVIALPSYELLPSPDNNDFTVTYPVSDKGGDHDVVVYAEDRKGVTAVADSIRVIVGNTPRQRAVLVAAGPDTDQLWPAIENNISLAYNALKAKGYTDSDIYILSPVDTITGVNKTRDADATPQSLDDALNQWAKGTIDGILTSDLVLYMIGNGGNGSYMINNTGSAGTVTAQSLDIWLDSLQSTTTALHRATVIYDAKQSGSFIPYLVPPAGKERIVITSTGTNETACFLADGTISFSRAFWVEVLHGVNVRDAYLHAKQQMSQSCSQQNAVINDNGDAIGNESSDGLTAYNYTIGARIDNGGNAPLIGAVTPDVVLSDGTKQVTIWAENITSTGSVVESVWAVITPPWHRTISSLNNITDLPVVPLLWNTTTNRYEGVYSDFSYYGYYDVNIYASVDGVVSEGRHLLVHQIYYPDFYEDDDSYDAAKAMRINSAGQGHNFHYDGVADDEDWVWFYGKSGETYEITLTNHGAGDAVLEVFDSSGVLLVPQVPLDLPGTNPPGVVNAGGSGADEMIDFIASANDKYYIRVSQVQGSAPAPGVDTGYDLAVTTPTGSGMGRIQGYIWDSTTGQRLVGVHVEAYRGNVFYGQHDSVYHPVPTLSGEYWIEVPPFTSADYEVRVTYGTYLTPEDNKVRVPNAAVFQRPLAISTEPIGGNCVDNDGDGYGAGGTDLSGCSKSTTVADCNDNDANIYPGGPPVRVRDETTGAVNYYSTLMEAYSSASNNTSNSNIIEIKMAPLTDSGTLLLNDTNNPNKSVILRTGFDCSYTSNTGGITTINGNVTISNGTIIIESGTLQIQ
jgi:hypothetical protein